MKLPATNLLDVTGLKPQSVLKFTTVAAPTHEEVVRFIHSKGRVHSHAIASWERLEAEVLQKYNSTTSTLNSEALFAKRDA